jgi:hypothetical protein
MKLLKVQALAKSYQDVGWKFIAVHSIYYHPNLVILAIISRLEYLSLLVIVIESVTESVS